jgi:precorrin-6x reductase
MEYRVWCTVYGGVTGRREAWLKENHRVYSTDSLEEACEKAKELNSKMSLFVGSAKFRYTVKRMGSLHE